VVNYHVLMVLNSLIKLKYEFIIRLIVYSLDLWFHSNPNVLVITFGTYRLSMSLHLHVICRKYLYIPKFKPFSFSDFICMINNIFRGYYCTKIKGV
ncbi:hypothetical protein CRH15_09165, partial [Lelliottia amnigena]